MYRILTSPSTMGQISPLLNPNEPLWSSDSSGHWRSSASGSICNTMTCTSSSSHSSSRSSSATKRRSSPAGADVQTNRQRSQPIRTKRIRLSSRQRAHIGIEVVDAARAHISGVFQGVPTQAIDGGRRCDSQRRTACPDSLEQ
jgi:hypothetical protein